MINNRLPGDYNSNIINDVTMPFSSKTIIIFFFIVPSLLYAGLVTYFTFDFFIYDRLWKSYNALALAIMNGALDVPYEAVGRESFTYNGKVYTYYGYFPVLLRLVLAPFIDLNTVTLSRISVWMMTTIGAASLQYALIFYYRTTNSTLRWDSTSKIKLIMLSLVVWLGSAHFVIVQKGVLFHEPYAAMLMLSSLFLVLVYRDVFLDFGSRKYRLVLYALLAALCVHTRQTIAVSLYIAVIILIIMKTIDTVNAKKSNDKSIRFKYYFYDFIKNGYQPLIVLFLGGAFLLFLNYLRFDDLFAMSKGEYGYRIAGEGFSARLCGAYITGSGDFEIGRIIPNLIYYLVGGGDAHAQRINNLGLGYVRLEYQKIQFILLWSSQIIIFLCVLWQLTRSFLFTRSTETILIFSLLTAFMVSPLLMLSYTTITVRYVADLWLPLGFAFLIFSKKILGENKFRTKYIWYFISLSILVNVAYSSYFYTEYWGWKYPKGDGLPREKVLKKLYKHMPLYGNIDEACKKYNFRVH